MGNSSASPGEAVAVSCSGKSTTPWRSPAIPRRAAGGGSDGRDLYMVFDRRVVRRVRDPGGGPAGRDRLTGHRALAALMTALLRRVEERGRRLIAGGKNEIRWRELPPIESGGVDAALGR